MLHWAHIITTLGICILRQSRNDYALDNTFVDVIIVSVVVKQIAHMAAIC